MDTIRIKVEINATVPEGKYCDTSRLKTKCENLDLGHCLVFGGRMSKGCSQDGKRYRLKCKQCLDLCKEAENE